MMRIKEVVKNKKKATLLTKEREKGVVQIIKSSEKMSPLIDI